MISEEQRKNSGPSISRSNVLAAAVAVPWIAPCFVLGATGNPAPGGKLNIAAVGVGGIGKVYIEECKGENIVALCDLDHTPDHTHTLILMAGIQPGKRIYCAKPVTHNIGERRWLR